MITLSYLSEDVLFALPAITAVSGAVSLGVGAVVAYTAYIRSRSQLSSSFSIVDKLERSVDAMSERVDAIGVLLGQSFEERERSLRLLDAYRLLSEEADVTAKILDEAFVLFSEQQDEGRLAGITRMKSKINHQKMVIDTALSAWKDNAKLLRDTQQNAL